MNWSSKSLFIRGISIALWIMTPLKSLSSIWKSATEYTSEQAVRAAMLSNRIMFITSVENITLLCHRLIYQSMGVWKSYLLSYFFFCQINWKIFVISSFGFISFNILKFWSLKVFLDLGTFPHFIFAVLQNFINNVGLSPVLNNYIVVSHRFTLYYSNITSRVNSFQHCKGMTWLSYISMLTFLEQLHFFKSSRHCNNLDEVLGWIIFSPLAEEN